MDRGLSQPAGHDCTACTAVCRMTTHVVPPRHTSQKHIQHKGWIGGWLMPQVGRVRGGAPSSRACTPVGRVCIALLLPRPSLLLPLHSTPPPTPRPRRCVPPQEKSYFALRLPHGWWLFGLDLALVDDIDMCQYRWGLSILSQSMVPVCPALLLACQLHCMCQESKMMKLFHGLCCQRLVCVFISLWLRLGTRPCTLPAAKAAPLPPALCPATLHALLRSGWVSTTKSSWCRSAHQCQAGVAPRSMGGGFASAWIGLQCIEQCCPQVHSLQLSDAFAPLPSCLVYAASA